MNSDLYKMDSALVKLSTGAAPPVLMFDYDGTLAPFVVERSEAFPYPQVQKLLQALCLQTGARVIVVSGREAREASRLLGISAPVEVWGCHGWQRIIPKRGEVTGAMPRGAHAMLEDLRKQFAHEGYGAQLETKPSSLALHWRGLTRDEQKKIQATAQRIWMMMEARGELEMHPFDGGLEWRLPNWSKAHAVETVVGEHASGTPVAYFGDDLTDEDAFKAMPEGGVAVLVREDYRPTAAQYWLRPPEELSEFLSRLLEALSKSAPSPKEMGGQG